MTEIRGRRMRTVFDTPWLFSLMRLISVACLRIAGWRMEGAPAPVPKASA